jgi:hypothetical protein
VQADARGQVRIEGLAPGPVRLRIEAPGFAALERVVEAEAKGETRFEATLDSAELMSTAIIRGLVQLARRDGAGATLKIDELGLVSRVGDGAPFSFRVPPGRYTLEASARGHRPQRKIVEIGAGEQAVYELVLERARR